MSKRVSARRVVPPKPGLEALPICADCPIGGREKGSGPVCPRAALCDRECAEQVDVMEQEGREWRSTHDEPPVDALGHLRMPPIGDSYPRTRERKGSDT